MLNFSWNTQWVTQLKQISRGQRGLQVRGGRRWMIVFLTACTLSWATVASSHEAAKSAVSTVQAVTATSATSAATDGFEVIRCKSGREIREIWIKSLTAGKKVPCEVVYKKADGEMVIYSAQAQEGYCEMKATEFSEKLTGLGFLCEL